ncbi:MAG: agmatine deiminase family protein [Methanomicrobiales archaeon]|nr:agmatine deiminase family protein [Methanomicrobiales archaeon]
MTNRRVRIGLLQTAVSQDLDRNLEKSLDYAESAIRRGAQIVCLQELFRTPYFPQEFRCDFSGFAETIPGPTTEAFAELAGDHQVTCIVPLFEFVPPHGYYNSAVVIGSDGRIAASYRKIHVPFDPLFYEKNYFRPGDDYRVVDAGCARIAVLICYDQWFPEAARIVALQGAEILFFPTAIGWIRGMEEPSEGDWHDAWETVQRGHAIANNLHLAAVNRVGQEGDLSFWGSSFVCDAFGNVLKRASSREEEVLLVDVDLGRNQEIRDGWRFLQNRRPDTYGMLLRDGCFGAGSVVARPRTPHKYGYTMPAEWEAHEAVWLAWPHSRDTFPHLEEVEATYVQMIQALRRSERVELLVPDDELETAVRPRLGPGDASDASLEITVTPYADVWFRDYGPTFVVNREDHSLAMVGWKFNAWGEKYTALMQDTVIPSVLQRKLHLPLCEPGIVLEGGSIDVNGLGVVMTTEQCLLHPNRNPTLSRKELERYMREYLGTTVVLWLREGIAGDDTDGHIDDIARFVDPATILCASEEDPMDENFALLQENLRILQMARDQKGDPFRIIPVPMPGRREDTGGRLPASYLNFYTGNRVVLVPQFGDTRDRQAREILATAFPGRSVIGIDCRALVEGMGTLHCVTQQQPRG